MTYALDTNGKLVHVDCVPRGLACKCLCPHCKSELVAKNGGNRKVHHFAHVNGSDCVGAIESALHKMAKDILQEHKLIMLPSVKQGGKGKQFVFDKIEIEVSDKDLSSRPDCIGYTGNGCIMWIEFKRSHEVDVKKAGKIISAKIDCVEIDLNSCELDPAKVRTFIESSEEMRKWIYNHENPHPFKIYDKSNYSSHHYFDDFYDFSPRIPRHIAIDEQNTIVNLCDRDEIDVNKHTYFCIACGKEVCVDVDTWGNYSFLHVDKNTPCEDDFYLHEAAKKVLCGRFNIQSKIDVYIPQRHLCEEGWRCPLYNENFCSIVIPISYDLKAYGYDTCEIEYKFPNEKFSYDAVLKRGDDLNATIVIVIYADTCYIEPENLKNRAIEIIVRCENDVLYLCKEPLRGERFRFLNFRHRKLNTASWEIINREVLKFTLFSSGKYYFGTESCMNMNITKISAIYEIFISENIENYKMMRQYAVLRCFKNQKELCLCEICYFLRSVDSLGCHEKICIRYKTKGTPRNPLETMPVKCLYFSLDKNIEAILEKECSSLKFIERDLTNR